MVWTLDHPRASQAVSNFHISSFCDRDFLVATIISSCGYECCLATCGMAMACGKLAHKWPKFEPVFLSITPSVVWAVGLPVVGGSHTTWRIISICWP